MGENSRILGAVAVVGLDVAKTVLQVHAIDAEGLR